jgi:CRP/FNR family cyclic AMP-dependent transcriptional regulator
MTGSPEERRALLARVPLFAALDEAHLSALVEATTTKRLKPRDELFHKDDEGTQVYVIASGRLKVVTTSADGTDVVFNILDAGEVVGELPLLAGGRRTATVAALEACELLVLHRRDFLQFLRTHPEAAVSLLAVLAERLTRVSELLEDTVFLNLPARLAKKLLYLCEHYGEADGEGVRLTLKLSQAELGNLVGTSRESVNKQIRAWSEAGVLEMDRGEIRILRMAELERLAGLVYS